MDYLEIKGDGLSLNGVALNKEAQSSIKVLPITWGINLKETCDRINQALQAFCKVWEVVKEIVEKIMELYTIQKEDICELCTNRGTRHGSDTKAGESKQAVANIKWSEKYRPP